MILSGVKKDHKSFDRFKKSNNSFCIEATHQSLLQPNDIKNNNQNGDPKRKISDKENDSFFSNQADPIDNKTKEVP